MTKMICDHVWDDVLNEGGTVIGRQCRWMCGTVHAYANCNRCEGRYIRKSGTQKFCTERCEKIARRGR